MANVSSLKGVRTRYRNILERELANSKEIICSDLVDQERSKYVQDAKRCFKLIKVYSEKLEEQSEKLTASIGDSDTEFVEIVLDEDSKLILDAEYCLIEIEQFLEAIERDDQSNKDHEESRNKASDTENLLGMQQQMQKMMLSQMQQQREFFERNKHKDKEVCSVKLPKLDLSSYGGNKLNWAAFWDAFECTVHLNKTLSNIDKFNYLLSKLYGEARKSVEGLALSNENYEVAIGILRERFGNTQDVVNLHYSELINIPPVSQKVESLRAFLDTIEKHFRSLEVLQEDINQHVFVSMITSKLPEHVLRQLELNKRTKQEWTVTYLREEIREYVTACEKAEKVSRTNKDGNDYKATYNRSNSQYNHKQLPFNERSFTNPQQRPLGSAQTLAVRSQTLERTMYGDKCRYCGEKHWSDECHKYKTIESRKKRLNGSCYRCLNERHITKDCRTNKVCVYCGQTNAHHRSLCPNKFNAKPSSVYLSKELNEPNEHTSDGQDVQETDHVFISSNEMVLMQTAKTTVTNTNELKSESVRILLDSGSQRTYITEKLAKNLGLKTEGEQELKLVTFGGEKAKIVKTKSTTIGIKLKNGTQMIITANIVPTISATMQRNPMTQPFSHEMEHLIKSVDLADTIPTEKESSTLEMLIGNDYYLDLVLSQKIEVAPGLYLLSSKLGWILSGRTNEVEHDKDDVNMLILTYGTDMVENSVLTSLDDSIPVKPDLEDFWKLESIGVNDKQNTSEDDMAMENFKDTVQRKEDGRYYVTWPWKDETFDLPLNRDLAFGRLKSCLKKLSHKPELLQKYDSIIQDQLQKGVIEKVHRSTNNNLQHYIPHHAVLKPQNTTTKLRVVYDASSKTKPEYKSLNECLFRGPVMLHDLCGLLLRFRLHKIALVSDIEKALQTNQRDVTRFLWTKSCNNYANSLNNIQEYRFCRVPFGVISSPFLLGATIEKHLDLYNCDIANKLKENIYVDNVITGTDNETEAVELYKTAKSIFKDASMNLRDWCSNSDKVNESILPDDRADSIETGILGHTWNRSNDTLAIKRPKVSDISDKITKRSILKTIASVFDPLGLSSPVLLKGKLLLQQLWSRNLNWDDAIEDDELQNMWTEIYLDLYTISDYQFKRCVCNEFSIDKAVYNLLCFCDASKGAYATTVYLHQESNGESKTDLLFAKTRLAPVKGMTIPRLELMAVLIGVRCVEFVKQQIKLPIQKVCLWTDSQCVLGWIKTKKNLPVFVKNRVCEIKNHNDVIFGYVNTKENPADIATRGTTTKELQSRELWWYGPSWLKQPFDTWFTSQDNENDHISEVIESVKDNTDSLKCSEDDIRSAKRKNDAPSAPFNIDCEKYSSMTKLIRVTAFVLRFVNKLRKSSHENGSLKSDELMSAEYMWLRYIQLRNFSEVLDGIRSGKSTNLERQLGLYKDKNGLLRSKGRLENSCLNEGARNPIVLPQKEKVTHMIVERVHKQNLHSGISHTLSQVRHRFWVLHGRAIVRSVIRACGVCRRNEGGPYKMPQMSPLPKSRVTESRPFSSTGLDYMGPLYIQTSDGAKKVWICLFTCFVTRAVHLELVEDMTAEQFLLCFRRFISQRGTPREIISDNAQQFKTASLIIDRIWKNILHSDDVQNYVSQTGIQYKFIVELSPWMGGFYERLVGVVKRTLRKSIGSKMLNLIKLQTLLKEIEAIVNSRPLVYVGDDINSTITLTPNHFLTLNPDIGVPEIDYDKHDREFRLTESSHEKLIEVWKKGQKLLDNFWKIWKEDYLTSLRERMQSSLKESRIKSQSSPHVGDIVLIKDQMPRGSWKMGKIDQLVSSRDGHIRSAKVLTASGRLLGRPLKLLYPIECSNTDNVYETEQNLSPNKTVCIDKKRPMRKAAEKARQNIKVLDI